MVCQNCEKTKMIKEYIFYICMIYGTHIVYNNHIYEKIFIA